MALAAGRLVGALGWSLGAGAGRGAPQQSSLMGVAANWHGRYARAWELSCGAPVGATDLTSCSAVIYDGGGTGRSRR